MSYISSVQPADLERSSKLPGFAGPMPPIQDVPPSPTVSLSTGLEVLLAVATLSGLSLVLCTILAGAF